ncbi:lysozyme [Microtetraspora sp. NBRC 13810]|uniref:glycoside hydrolase family 25 protein n=1 Tax=Microtetraspora sp. NBRC 13810 TaxID=3030990 RepID=UPI0024A36904|nr:GH25 family lysozyme [Microtetraspora sp. NBRC 13810]GLW07064.1 lysozyme [Microtetraspora sp. NBRC 13810]
MTPIPRKLCELATAAALLTATGLTLPGSAYADIRPTLSAEQQRSAPLTYGQDVSGYEPAYDWAASPAEFGIVKATEGLSFVDGSFARHWRELADKGIVRGAYHYGHPANDPVAEADHFLSVLNGQRARAGDLLVLDLEETDGRSVEEVNSWARTWLAHVKAKTGTTPLFYSSWNFANVYGRGLSGYPLWVANYSTEKGSIDPPADWKTWTIHQYSDSPVDQNVSALSPAQLRALGRPSTAA